MEIKNRILAISFCTIGFAGYGYAGNPVITDHSEKRLNILFLLSDQHRGDAMGVAGSGWAITPTMDQLAHEGVTFTRAYASVPSCLPARTSLLTGMSPWQSGQLGYKPIARYQYEKPAIFSAAGYRTHAVGKNHFIPKGDLRGYQSAEIDDDCYPSVNKNPDYQKSDYTLWFEKNAPGKNVDATGLGCDDHRGGRVFPYEEYLHPTAWTASRAIDFLKTYNGEQPFFLKVSFHRPHPPFDPPKRWFDIYEEINIPMPSVGEWAEKKFGHNKGSLEDNGSSPRGSFPKDEVMNSLWAYYAGLAFVDEQMALVIDALRERGELENTLIVYTSDHGDMMGDHHLWRKCRPYEGSARIPMIIRWPENKNFAFKRGQVRTELVELRDVLPTFLDAAGIEKPDAMDGTSMLDVLRGKKWRNVIDLEHAQIYEPDNGWVALTDKRYKYIYFNLSGEEQLFDLVNDPHELNNMADDYNKHVRLLKSWRRKMIGHLSIRGGEWVKDGKLVVQEKAIYFGKNHPDYSE